MASEEDGGGSWDGYSSQFMFPAEGTECSCEHETVYHDYASCGVDGCPCEAYWEYT